MMQSSDITYLGAFKYPGDQPGPGGWQDVSATWSYAQGPIAFNPAKGTLFATGHTYAQHVGELSIPTPSLATSVSALPSATLLQPLTDVLAGKLSQVGSGAQIAGMLVLPTGTLVVSASVYYDATGSQTKSHFLTGTSFSSLPAVQGPATITNGLGGAGFVSGYMGVIPVEWQTRLGGQYLVGNGCLSIISRTSYGPSVTVVSDLSQVGNGLTGTTVLGYPQSNPTLGPWVGSGPANPVFNQATALSGVLFPAGTDTVLFIGRTGLGPQQYGEGTGNPALAGTVAPDGATYVYDPTSSAKGTHAYPYAEFVWAYNANDLLLVKQGQKKPWEIVPYATWSLTQPFQSANASPIGVAFDAATGRVFIADAYTNGAQPVIRVWQTPVSTAPIQPPPVTPPVPPPTGTPATIGGQAVTCQSVVLSGKTTWICQ